MALLLLQDCLIDLSNIDNSISIEINESLVDKILNNGCFDEEDSSELLRNLKDFINKNHYQTNIIYVSSVFFNIPFFEEKLKEETKLELKSIFDYVRDINNKKTELLEIGKYFRCETTFDYEQNKRTSFKIEPFNLDNEIFGLFSNTVNFSITDIKNILKLNNDLDPETYTDIGELGYAQLKTTFSNLPSDISVADYYKKLNNYFEETSTSEVLILNQLAIMHFFHHGNIIKLEEKTVLNIIKNNKNNFSIELLPYELTFDNEIVFNFWTDNDEANIIVKNNEMTGELRIDSKEKNKNTISLSELNLNKTILKADSLNNLSCKITDLKNNSIATTKIKFN